MTWTILPAGTCRLDGVEEADELLVPVALHAAAEDGAVEDVEGGEQRGGAVALVVVGHGAGAALLHGQAGLGAVERLDLRLLVDRQHHGMGRRVDIEADDVPELGHELGIVRELEAADAMRRQAVRPPDALDRGDADAGRLGHRGSGPMGRLVRRLGRGQRHHLVDDLLAERRNARRPGLVAQQAVDPFRGEAFLPAPDAGLRLARPAHDLDGAKTVRRKQHDLGPPGMLLRGVAVTDDRPQAAAIDGAEGDGDTRAHAPESHGSNRSGIPSWIQSSDLIH